MTEGRVAGYLLVSLVCTAKTANGAPGRSTVDVSGSTASIHLVAREHVTCVYNNAYVPPAGGLTIRKLTSGGVGSFDYVVTPVSGGATSHHLEATTTEPNVPVDATPSLLSLPPGSYTISERQTESPAGNWHLAHVSCNGSGESTTKPITVEIHSGEATTCTFANVFVPSGSISLAKRTTGATGTASFLISSQAEPPTQYRQTATTTVPGVAAGAKPVAAVDATDHLPLGTYTITEEQPASSAANGWSLTEVECNGVLEPFEEGTIEVKLTHPEPKVHCVYTDAFSTSPPIPPPPPPKPEPPGPQPDYALSDLFVTKHVSPTVVTRGQVASYRITVKNLGPDAAERVEVDDEPQGGVVVISAHSSQGACTTKLRSYAALERSMPARR